MSQEPKTTDSNNGPIEPSIPPVTRHEADSDLPIETQRTASRLGTTRPRFQLRVIDLVTASMSFGFLFFVFERLLGTVDRATLARRPAATLLATLVAGGGTYLAGRWATEYDIREWWLRILWQVSWTIFVVPLLVAFLTLLYVSGIRVIEEMIAHFQ